MSMMTSSSESPLQASSVRCVQCGEEASLSRRYCGKCGHLLWEPCLVCGENNPVDERFCGKCGSDIDAEVQSAQQELAKVIATVDDQAAKGRFLDAVATLEGLSIAEHSLLQASAAQIRHRIESFPQQRQKAIEFSKRVVGNVHQLLQEKRYERSLEQLTAVPNAFRNQEINDLLEEVETRVRESRALRQRVKDSLQRRDFQSLLPQVERLAELAPDDQQVLGLLAQLQQRQGQRHKQESAKLLAAAKAALAKCDYRQAQEALQKLPANTKNDPDTAKTVLAIKERVWLANQLGTEPFLSPTLLTIAERLLKLQPHDQRHAELAKRLHTRWLKANRENHGKPIPWAKSHETSVLGLPVAPLSLPTELVASAKTDHTSAQGMVVAFGLALQGLGKAEISLDLAPKEKRSSWLNRLTTRGKRQAVQRAWGIDIGTKNLKAIQLVANDQDNTIAVSQSLVVPLRSRDENDEADAASLAEAVQRLVQQCSLDGEDVALNLPGTQTLHRFFDIPAAKPAKFFEAVEYEMRARIPLEAEQVLFDYHWSELPTANDGPPQRRVLLAAANRNHVKERLQAFADAGVSRLLVQGDCLALGNAIWHCRPTAAAGETVGVVEIGAGTSNFVILSGSTLWCRGLFHGTDAFDEAIAVGMDKTAHEAELLRCKPETLAAMHELDELLTPEFSSFAEELERTLGRFQNETGQSVSRLYLCGAGSLQYGLLRHLQSRD